MGRPSMSTEQGGRCRRHPRHRQATGVCPYCLRECLSHLSHHHYPSATAYLSSSASSSDSDVSSSEDSSPLHRHGLKSTAMASLLLQQEIRMARGGLTENRSMVFLSADGGKEEEEEKGKEKEEIKKTRKKEKGWRKAMSGSKRSWRNKEEGYGGANLMHSQTFKEKQSAKWVLFA